MGRPIAYCRRAWQTSSWAAAIDPATHERTTTDAVRQRVVPTDSLTTHGVIVGMTGSGKTGLGVILIEEALRAGLPVLAIDPKGDLTNLCLTFPDLAPDDFRPWIDEAQAKNAGQSPDDFAASQAALWTKGLAGWGLERRRHRRPASERTDFTIYTPGSEAGTALNIMGSLQVPADMSDAEVVADEIEGYVTGLLGLVGIAADPLASREHILLSNLIHHSWSEGRALDLMTLVGMVPSPPIRKLGVFDVDQFFPADDRMALAMKLNGLLASPSFASWAMGSSLDIQSMLFTPDGRGRCAIVTTAHLSDDERQFVTSLILSKLVTWMRRQSGTTDLRALLYMDEVAGYLPPTAKPPTKKPIMTLMKQARAFGVGVVLSTQNPVDLDYKAMSNAGTWMIGRLQTERDKARLLDGMSSAAGSVDVAAVDATISGLGKREFMLRRAGRDEPEVFTTRWAMSYLRGPMTRDQIALVTPAERRLRAGSDVCRDMATAPHGRSWATTTPPAPDRAAPPSAPSDESAVMPEVADGIAGALGRRRGAVARRRRRRLARHRARSGRGRPRGDPLRRDQGRPRPRRGVRGGAVPARRPGRRHVGGAGRLRRPRPAHRRSGRRHLPAHRGPIATKTFFNQIERDLRDHLTRSLTLEIPANTDLKLYGRPGETPEEFATRCASFADERADEEIAKLRDKYEAKATKLRDQIEAAEDRVDVLEEEAKGSATPSSSRRPARCSADLLGGKKSKTKMLGDMLGDAGTAARRRGSTSASGRRVDAAENKVERLVEQAEELEAELEDDVTEIAERWDTAAAAIEPIDRGPRTHRRQGHPADAGVAARRLSSSCSAAVRAPCRRRDSNSH